MSVLTSDLWVAVDTDTGMRVFRFPTNGAAPVDTGIVTQGSQNRQIISFSPDGKLIATVGSFDVGTIIIVDAATLEPLDIPNPPEAHAESVGFSPDGRFFYYAGSSLGLIVYETENWARVYEQSSGGFRRYDWAPDGSRLYSVPGSNSTPRVQVLDTETWQPIPIANPINSGSVSGGVVSPDGSRYVVATGTTTMRIYDTSDMSLLPDFVTIDFGADSFAFSPDGTMLSSSNGTGVQTRLFETETWQIIDPYVSQDPDKASLVPVRWAAFSQDGEQYAFCVWNFFEGQSPVQVFDTATGNEIVIPQPQFRCVFLAWQPPLPPAPPTPIPPFWTGFTKSSELTESVPPDAEAT